MDGLEHDWKLVVVVIAVGLKSVEELCHPPTGLVPMPHTSVALTAHYLNVR